MMVEMREEVSPNAFGTYVISMTHAASHVMEVMLLARLAGLAGRSVLGWFCAIRVSPLFETIEDLAHVEQVLKALLDDSTYGALLKASGNMQEVMLGYSDSCKDGGILALRLESVRGAEENHPPHRCARRRLPPVPRPRRHHRPRRWPDL